MEGIRFVGRDGPRLFPATRRETVAAPGRFVERRLAGFGPYEDAARRPPGVPAGVGRARRRTRVCVTSRPARAPGCVGRWPPLLREWSSRRVAGRSCPVRG
jgi:hypothetical protein